MGRKVKPLQVWQTLESLPPGLIFITEDGVSAVKSEYRYPIIQDPMCILLYSGEYAHFTNGGKTMVKALHIKDEEGQEIKPGWMGNINGLGCDPDTI